ncbi:MAG: hypothetical protein KBC76_01460 [Deltaproteobacteria bacterium]|jgi:hypothetical protein|nr:hypothetical protein [Deltaproteobacteria bacterium]
MTFIANYCEAKTTPFLHAKYFKPEDAMECQMMKSRKPYAAQQYFLSDSSSSDLIYVLIQSQEWIGIGIETAIMSESALKDDWMSAEEDEAWRLL